MSYLATIAAAVRESNQAVEPIPATVDSSPMSPGDRSRAIANHPALANHPSLREMAMEAAKRAPAHVTAEQVVSKTIESFSSNADARDASRAAEGLADPFAVVDQRDEQAENHGWSKAIASVPVVDGAVASGGPFPAHSSMIVE